MSAADALPCPTPVPPQQLHRSSQLDQARIYLERVVPWQEGTYVNLHYTVPNKKFDPTKPEGRGNKKFYLNGQAFTTPQDAIDHLAYLVGGRSDAKDIYACMSAQVMAEAKVVGRRNVLEAKRGTEYAAGLKALFIDLDVKAAEYATPATAFGEMRRFIAEVGMPRPTMAVSSGTGGAHLYWVLDRVLTRAEWQPLANALAEATRRHGLKVDTACTVDSARILRVPETWNHKGTPPLPVVLGRHIEPSDAPLDDMRRILLPYMGAQVVRLPTASTVTKGPVSELAAGIQAPSAPPVDIDSIKPLCGFVATALDTGGQSYAQPLWNLTTLLATFTQSARGDGRWAAHEMAKGHPGYAHPDTDALYDRKVAERDARNIGWPSCAAVENAGCASCGACPLRSLNKSPLAHGASTTHRKCSTEHQFDPASLSLNADADQKTEILTEDSAAQEFATHYAGQLLYCHSTGRWHIWSGAAWQPNECDVAFQSARELARRLSAQHNPRARYLTGRASFAGAVEKFAKSDPSFAVTIDSWDADPWLLGTPGGTVNLRTGVMRDACREERITKLTAVAPAVEANCPTWLRFIADVTQGDSAYAHFLKQLCGYCLTGDTSEQALFFAYGDGGNGKGVFIHTLDGIMGDYATAAAMETFTASKHDRHSTEVASMRGARLVTASETEQGRKFAESRIKQLTGGDMMRARFMRQDEFEFKPVLKLLLVGNTKPGLSNVDNAARRRFNLMPFLFKPAVTDPFLEQKLQIEWPEILRWMIEGCLDLQRNGLQRPPIVQDATNDYFETQDTFKQWMDQACIVQHGNANRKATAQALFASWGQFALANNEPVGNMKGFGERMDRLNFKKNKNVPVGSTKLRGYDGIELKPPAATQTK